MNNVINMQFTDDDLNYVFIIRYKGGKYSFEVPFELKGRGISPWIGVTKEGWYSYMATTRAFRRLYNQNDFIKQAFEKRHKYGWTGTYEQLFNES